MKKESKEKKHFHVFGKDIKDEEIIHYDVCILGGGPAGLTAGIYSSRYKLHTALITKNIGGMASLAERIENYPGFEGSGCELMQLFHLQARRFGTEFLNSEVADIAKDKTGFVIELKNGGVVHAKTIILALGTEKKKLAIPGEEKFLGKGVSYCAVCDSNFFMGKRVAVIGGGDSACKSALLLAKIAKKVYVIYRGEGLKCPVEKGEVDKAGNIEIIYNTLPLEIKGDENVEVLEIMKEGRGKQKLKIDGIFIEAGSVPASSIVKKLKIKLDKQGYVNVNQNMETNVPGIFASGDAVKSKLKQVVVAAGQGAIAAKSAYDFLVGK